MFFSNSEMRKEPLNIPNKIKEMASSGTHLELFPYFSVHVHSASTNSSVPVTETWESVSAVHNS